MKLSQDQNCVGTYNAEALSPADNCLTDGVTPTFLAGGQVRAHITLEDADAIPVEQLNQTLCVVLGGQPDNAAGLQHCARDSNGVILFKGDWCSTSNLADDCGDSMRLVADFAASAVTIN